jgi:hypothetical protein
MVGHIGANGNQSGKRMEFSEEKAVICLTNLGGHELSGRELEHFSIETQRGYCKESMQVK